MKLTVLLIGLKNIVISEYQEPRKTELQRVEPTDAAVIADELTVILTQIWDSCPTPTLDGQYTLTADTYGGTAPYTYLWDCVPTGIPNTTCVSNPQDTGNWYNEYYYVDHCLSKRAQD
jgi:hypothetical protein